MDGTREVLRELVEEMAGVCEDAPDIGRACEDLLELIASALDVERGLIAVRHGDVVAIRVRGLTHATVDALERELRPDGLGAGPMRDAEPPSLMEAIEAVPELLGSGATVPFQAPEAEFEGLLVLDPAGPGSIPPGLSPAIQRTASSLARLARMEALRTEVARHQAEMAQLQTLFEALPDPIVVMDRDHQLAFCNRRAASLLLTSPDDSAGRRRAVETNNIFFSAFRARAALMGENESLELLLVDPFDGTDLLFEASPAEIPAAEAASGGHVFILRDITDLKRAASELQDQYKRSVAAEHRARRESERLNVILSNIGVPILVTDGWSDIVLMNPGAARLFEHADGDLPGSLPVRRAQANGARITGLISNFLLQSRSQRTEDLELVEPNGARDFPAKAVLTKITNDRGEVIAVVCVIDDLTEAAEIQRLAEELQQLNQELELRIQKATTELSDRNRELERQGEELARASRMKTEFLAMMSHELRTPLNAILGYNSLLKEGVLGEVEPRQEEALERIEASSEHLLSLINDLLDLSKVEAGMIALMPTTVDTKPFLRALSGTIRPSVEAKGLTFLLEVQEDVPPVRADLTRLRQVILNLTSNAVKFTSMGRIALRAFPLSDRRYVRFEVEDTGRGIGEEEQQMIFEGFYQVDPFESRGEGGTGLGLNISQRLVSLMGGKLSVQSRLGEGSVFFADLPVATSVEDSADPDPDSRREGERTSRDPATQPDAVDMSPQRPPPDAESLPLLRRSSGR